MLGSFYPHCTEPVAGLAALPACPAFLVNCGSIWPPCEPPWRASCAPAWSPWATGAAQAGAAPTATAAAVAVSLPRA